MLYIDKIRKQNKIKDLYKNGFTQNEIASIYGVTRQRIQQLLSKPIRKPEGRLCKKCGDEFLDENFITKYCVKCKKAMDSLSGRDRTRQLVRDRDHNQCQVCKKKWRKGGRRFDVHHLGGDCGKFSRSYDKVGNISALITLCHKCHFNHPSHTFGRIAVQHE